MLPDLRFAFRQFTKSAGFSGVAVAILALGIGANTAIFSVVNALMLRPLPYDRAEELVAVYENLPGRGIDTFAVAGPKYLEWRKRNSVFQEIGALSGNTQSLTGAGEPVPVTTCQVTPSYLHVWRLRAFRGRLFAADDDRAEKRDIAILTHSLWQRQFGGREDIIGLTVQLDGKPHTVVGVLAAGGLPTLDGGELVFVPLAAEKIADGPGVHYYQVAARLKPGVTVEQSQAAMTVLADTLRKENRAFGDWGVMVRGARADYLGEWPDARSVLLLQGAVALLLLIACANIATLLLARAVARKKEIAVRLALGGSRGRIIRQLLSESVLLALFGGAAGFLLASFCITAANAWLKSQGLIVWTEVSLDQTALVFSLGLSFGTGILFGLVPAWQATKPDVQATLRTASANTTAGVAHRRLLDTLTIVEIALALVLLIGAGLFVRTLTQLRDRSPGFTAARVLTVQTSLAEARYKTDRLRDQFVAAALGRLEALPGVRDVAAIDVVPMAGGSSWDIYIVGRPRSDAASYGSAETRRISPEYFHTMGMSLLRGRAFSSVDIAGAPAVAIINEAVARHYFPGVDPVGQQIELGDGIANPKTIIGVVPDERVAGLTSVAPQVVYVPMAQGWFKGASTSYALNFVVRTASDPIALVKPIQREIRALDPDIAFANVKPMTWFVGVSIRSEFMRSGMLAAFSATALLLAALGIYGVVANTVSQRTNEFGIRLALGAEPAAILRLVFRRGLRLVVLGSVIGLAAALAGTRFLKSFLHDVNPTDPFTIVIGTLFLAAVACFATWLPARRATRISPMEALCAE